MGLMLDLVPNHMGVLEGRQPLVARRARARPRVALRELLRHRLGARGGGPARQGAAADPRAITTAPCSSAASSRCASTPRPASCRSGTHEHRLPIRPAEYPRVLLASGHRRLARRGTRAEDALRRIADCFAAFAVRPGRRGRRCRDAAEAGTEADALARRALAAACRDPAVTRSRAQRATRSNGTAGEPASFDALDALIARPGLSARVLARRRRRHQLPPLLRHQRPRRAAGRVRRTCSRRRTGGCSSSSASGKVECLRIDHPDGLRDPGAYFERLQSACASALGEHAGRCARARAIRRDREDPRDARGAAGTWPVARRHRLSLHERRQRSVRRFRGSATRFDRLYAAFIGEHARLRRRAAALEDARSSSTRWRAISTAWPTSLTRIAKRDRRTCDFTRNAIRRALVEIVACFPVYRTYVDRIGCDRTKTGAISTGRSRGAKRASTADETSVFDFIGAILARRRTACPIASGRLCSEFVARFQQFTAPAMAKGMEDTSFYVYNRLVSLNEVGGDPRAFGIAVSAFHRASRRACQHCATNAMLATVDARQQARRGRASEDRRPFRNARRVAIRAAPLAAVQSIGIAPASRARLAPSRNDEYLLYQTLLGAWPLEPLTQPALDAFAARIHAYMHKAVREAKAHTSWINPQAGVRGRACALHRRPCSARRSRIRSSPTSCACTQRLAPPGCLNSSRSS